GPAGGAAARRGDRRGGDRPGGPDRRADLGGEHEPGPVARPGRGVGQPGPPVGVPDGPAGRGTGRVPGVRLRPQPRLLLARPRRLPMTPARVLFVCVENANRSQMAEAFARVLGGGRVEAFSAGSRPSGRVNPKAVEAMREVGCDLLTHCSKALADLPDVEFDAAVTMGCGDS